MVRANAPAVRMRLRFVHRHQAIDQLPYNLHDTYERSLAARFALEPHLFYVACLHRIQVLQTHQELVAHLQTASLSSKTGPAHPK